MEKLRPITEGFREKRIVRIVRSFSRFVTTNISFSPTYRIVRRETPILDLAYTGSWQRPRRGSLYGIPAKIRRRDVPFSVSVDETFFYDHGQRNLKSSISQVRPGSLLPGRVKNGTVMTKLGVISGSALSFLYFLLFPSIRRTEERRWFR